MLNFEFVGQFHFTVHEQESQAPHQEKIPLKKTREEQKKKQSQQQLTATFTTTSAVINKTSLSVTRVYANIETKLHSPLKDNHTPLLSQVNSFHTACRQTHAHNADLTLDGIVLHGSTSMKASYSQTYPHPPAGPSLPHASATLRLVAAVVRSPQ